MTDALFELKPDNDDILRTAHISPDGMYRWTLTRVWGATGKRMTFIMLNPSTADALIDDPTIRRCVGFARAAGMGALEVVNLYAYRATQPEDLWLVEDPVGGSNDGVLRRVLKQAADQHQPVVAAWGTNARPDRVEWLLRQPHSDRLSALRVTKGGAPGHPLYLPAACTPQPWPGEAP
jgi:hypothetical protein